MLLTITITATLLFGIAGMLLSTHIRNPRDEKLYHFRCTSCGQKLRYLASKAGRAGMCPRCRTKCTFPREGESSPSFIQSTDGYAVRVGVRRCHSA
jgi:hypothetical protein